MSRILVIGENSPLIQAQADSLGAAGHRVEVASDIFCARDRLCGEPCDIVVIDVRFPDGGMGLLIEQARAAWPDCAVVALVQRSDLRRTKIHEMGLWTPDAALVHPISAEDLLRAVAAVGERGDAAEGAAH